MKKLIPFFFSLLFCTVGFAQNFNIGIKTGLGSSKYNFEELDYTNPGTLTVITLKPIGSVFSYNIGVVGKLDIPALPISARLGLQYTNLGGQVQVFEKANNLNRHIEEHNGRIDIPIQATVNLSVFRIIGGVAYAIDVSRSTAVVDYLTVNYVETNRFDFAVSSEKLNYWTYNIGAGVELGSWAIDLIYEGAMSQNIGGSRESNNFIFAPNAGQFTINFTYFLLNKE